MELLGQIIGIIAMCANVLSFQCKSNKRLVLVISVGTSLFAVSYLMLGQPSAAAFNIISAICSIACLKDKFKNKYVFGAIVALFLIATWVTYGGWWSLMLMTAQIVSSYTIMFRSGTFIRNARLFFISPVWLINNTVMCFTVGGIICEVISMVSVIVSFIRYKSTGFED